jgi:single-strand DNA-binding protein
MASLNSCSFIGNLGKDPEVKQTQSGDKVANITIACSEKWKGRDGERKERTTWVPVIIWGPLAEIAERYLRKGSKVYITGKFSVRKWQDRDGHDRYSTEIVLQGPQAQLVMLDGAPADTGGGRQSSRNDDRRGGSGDGWGGGGLDDEIPF